MKVKCTKLLDAKGNEVRSSPWLKIGEIYHVLSMFFDPHGNRMLWINFQPLGEWPSLASHQIECFEIVSNVIPSNWRFWIHENLEMGISPAAWQNSSFYQGFFDHDPETYASFEKERDIILKEDP